MDLPRFLIKVSANGENIDSMAMIAYLGRRNIQSQDEVIVARDEG